MLPIQDIMVIQLGMHTIHMVVTVIHTTVRVITGTILTTIGVDIMVDRMRQANLEIQTSIHQVIDMLHRCIDKPQHLIHMVKCTLNQRDGN